jgi:hypothetical protein
MQVTCLTFVILVSTPFEAAQTHTHQLMHTVTNNYRDAHVLNLGSGGERGPYLVTQTGVAPSDPLAKERMFVLRPDGRWVDFNAYACQGNPEAMDEIVFPTMTKVTEIFSRLFGRPRVLDLPVDEERLKAWIERQEHGDPLERAHAWATDYRKRHPQKNKG